MARKANESLSPVNGATKCRIITICGLKVLLNVTQITILTQDMPLYFANEIPKIIAVHTTDIRWINTVRYG
jgi:hypothetical protein